MNKKPNSNSSAGTTADSDKTPKIPTSSHACSNTFVIGSQCPPSDLEVQKAKDFVWEHMEERNKKLMIEMSSKTFIESPDLRFYLTASVVKQGVVIC